ncbi:MAG: CrcB family protein [Ilumatobacter sp.]|uniref:fluoride efflux transporter FluC n=1 Tax=Ilumatobacter sp. TaxID=1967498 RepID=UPI00261161B1|nr:CrcB family protein [Ilumatobacter sp.]MDJ0770054.1 CrcB family protein [Ilumatobacter sp.]
MTPVLFVLASALGAAVRLRVNQYGWTWISTLVVNVVGAFGLGWLLAGDPSDGVATVVGTGFFGSLTTFSMFALEATSGPTRRRIAIIASTLVLGMLAAVAGHAVR